MEEELQCVTSLREIDVKALANALKENQKHSDNEQHALKHETALLKEQHVGQVRKLKTKIRKTQESHQVYLTRLMDVLETTHALREQETASISAELCAAKQEKDSHILMLQQEVRALRAMKGGSKNIKSAVNSRSMRKHLERESDSRARRSAQFDVIV